MANDKELLKKLYAIVAKQQKIIVKMAQAAPAAPATPFTGKNETPPADLDPNKVTKEEPGAVFFAALPQGLVSKKPEVISKEMHITFSPGKRTQSNYDLAKNILQKLTDDRKILSAYKLVVAD